MGARPHGQALSASLWGVSLGYPESQLATLPLTCLIERLTLSAVYRAQLESLRAAMWLRGTPPGPLV